MVFCWIRRAAGGASAPRPLSKSVLLGSRALSAMLILGVVFAFARVVFGVKVEGSLLGLIGVCAAFSLMTAGYGMLIAALATSRFGRLAGCFRWEAE